MSRPLTDREVVLEARVAELEDELAAWRHDADQVRVNAARMKRAVAIRDRLQPLDVRCALAACGIFMCLVDHPGAAIPKARLVAASRYAGEDVPWPSSSRADEPEPKVVAVQVAHLRSALRQVGLEAAIEAVWGVGYRVSAENAARLKARFDPEASDG